MVVDLYTKFILTVIALGLLLNAFNRGVSVASAEPRSIQRVAVCDPVSERCARVGKASQPGSEVADVLLVVNYGGD